MAAPEIRRAATVAAYVSVSTEPGTGPLLDALHEAGKRVILPLLAPSLAVAFIFRTISAVQVFDIPYTFIQQAPAQGLLETLGVYIYRTGIEFLDFGYAAALSVALFALSLAVTAVYVRFVRDGGNS